MLLVSHDQRLPWSLGLCPHLHGNGGLVVKATHAVGRTRLPRRAALLHVVEGLGKTVSTQ